MKKFKYLIILPVIALLLTGINACKRGWLDVKPLGTLNATNLNNSTGVRGLLIGAYSMLRGQINWGSSPTNWTFGSVAGGDSYKGSIPSDQFTEGAGPVSIFSVDPTNGYVREKWVGIYNGVQRANEVLRIMSSTTDISDADKKTITGEVRFLRGYFHMEARKLWKAPPYVDETVTVAAGNINVPNIDASGNQVEIWPKIEADLQFAMDNLPATQPDRARANSWAAMALLAKAYMFQNKFQAAKALLDKLILSGVTAGGQKYALVNYESNFNAANDNSAESVFAVQFSVNDGSGTAGRYGDNLNFPNGSGPGGCCGFNNPSISLANAFKTDANGLPLLDTYNSGPNVGAATGTTITDAGVKSFYTATGTYNGNLDPRIDWAMGRPGVPYFDWGVVPSGLDWIRDPGTNGPFSPKKNVYAKSQAGSLASTETSFWGPTQMDANNYDIIRFADIILWAAEAEAEVGTLAQSMAYVNMIRTRAADPTGWVYLNSVYSAATGKYVVNSTPADNYKVGLYTSFPDKAFAKKAIMHERYMELAMEGHRFFDLQRWDKASPGLMATVLNAYIAAEVTRPSLFSVNPSAKFTKGKNEYYPVPQGQIDIENSSGTVNLKQDPAY
ncbi:MAG: RagB/SusD protein [Chitinophagaceae bacterium]|nr:RagB/SusD protein [Chitinophagaceae bacterium]